MEGNQPVDLTPYLASFSEENPVGTDPRQDPSINSFYLKMKDARAEARRLERALDMDGDGSSPASSWEAVLASGEQILTSQGKDLEVAAWMTEALVRVGGFSGLLAGLKLCQALVERYWDLIYPLPDEDGFEGRLLPFLGLNGQSEEGPLIQCLRKLPITGPSQPYAFWEYTKALEISNTSDKALKAEKIAAGNISLDDFNLSVAAASPKFFKELVDVIQEVIESLGGLYSAFYERVGVDAPAVSGISNTLQQILDAIEIFAKQKLDVARSASEDHNNLNEESGPGSEAVQGGDGSVKGGPGNREAALSQLLKIARFFRENEPHSPISYTLEELVKRARMSLPDLLEELIVDENARNYYFISTGMGVQKHNADT